MTDTDRQTQRQIDRLKERFTQRHGNRHTPRCTDKYTKTDKLTNRHIIFETDGHISGRTDVREKKKVCFFIVD